jgi:hypothetical protein
VTVTNQEELFAFLRKQNAKKQVGIMIATPMFGGQCYGEYALSLVRSVTLLRNLGFKVRVESLFNESLIPRARNRLAHSFMQNPEYEYMIFIDADVGFDDMAILKLLLADRDVSAAVYPRKNINWPLIEKAAKAGKENLQDYSARFVFNAINLKGETDDDGMVEVTHAATGFMMIKRTTLEKLATVVRQYTDRMDDELYVCHEFFKCDINDEGRFTSEDYYFCDVWRNTGGKIYLNPFIQLSHTGTYRFEGNLARMGTEAL